MLYKIRLYIILFQYIQYLLISIYVALTLNFTYQSLRIIFNRNLPEGEAFCSSKSSSSLSKSTGTNASLIFPAVNETPVWLVPVHCKYWYGIL